MIQTINTKNHTHHWKHGLLLLGYILLGWAASAQELPYPDVHYPLLTSQKPGHAIILGAWDVSGNAKHGNTWNATKKRYYEFDGTKNDTGFFKTPYLGFVFPPGNGPEKYFPDLRQKNVLYKPAEANNKDLHINIPDPLPHLSQTVNAAFTVSFWIYLSDNYSQQTIINTKFLGVWVKDRKLYVEHYNSATGATSTENLFWNVGQWYFVSIMVQYPSYTFVVHDGVSLQAYTKDPGVFNFQQPLDKSQILDADFKEGSICNMRFYHQILTAANLDEIVAEDIAFGSNLLGPTDERVRPNHYIKRNMYSHFPFNKEAQEPLSVLQKNAITRFGTNDALTMTNGTAVDGRKGDPSSAIELTLGGRLTLNPFFGNYFDNYVSSTEDEDNSHAVAKGFTVSFWIKLKQPVSSPKGVIAPPFNDQTPKSRIFGLTDGLTSGTQNNPFVWGYSRLNDRLSLRRYNEDVHPANQDFNRYSWELWHYDPVAFTDAGWYHVVYSQHSDWFTTFIYDTDGTPACQSVYWEIQQALKNNPATREWFIGAPSTEVQENFPDLVLDDFKIYNWPLTAGELDALHESETFTTPSNASRACACAGEMESMINTVEASKMAVFPNPAKDRLTINITAVEEGMVKFILTDLQGKILRTGTQKMFKGQQQIQIQGLNYANGMYILKVEGPGIKENRKVMIQR